MTNIRLDDVIPVFGNPDNVVLDLIGAMVEATNTHGNSLAHASVLVHSSPHSHRGSCTRRDGRKGISTR